MERMGTFAVGLGYASGLFCSVLLLFLSVWVPNLHLMFTSRHLNSPAENLTLKTYLEIHI